MTTLNDIKRNIDWSQVTSIVVAGLIVGVSVYGLRKVGLGTVATVVKGA